MPCFQKYVLRHGEIGVQDLIERLERYEGLRGRLGVPLEERWNRVMVRPDQFELKKAA